MEFWNNWKRTLQKLIVPPRAERVAAPKLAAEYELDSTATSGGVKDMSATGIYMITEKRLHTNDVITLVLREDRAPENSSELKFSIHARVVRQGQDGFGLSFVLPPGLDTKLWEALVQNILTLTGSEDLAAMFRSLRTILFLCGLCQSGAKDVILMFAGQLGNERGDTLVKIVLAAEDMLAQEPDFDRRRLDPAMAVILLREGSWHPDEIQIKLWEGLFVSSCTVDEADDSNKIFAGLLMQLTPNLARIFNYACEQAVGPAQDAEHSPSTSIQVTQDKLAALTTVTDHGTNTTSVAYLYNLGLITKTPDFTSYRPLENLDITPTNLGLELYKHCLGGRGKVDPQLILAAEEILRDIIPNTPIIPSAGPTASTPE